MNELLRETKLNIRGVIESSTRPLMLHEMRKQYEDLTFKSIPFRELGYSTLFDFCKNIPDTVYIVDTIKGPVVEAVPSKESAHVERMVREQKNSKKGNVWDSRHFQSYMPPRFPNTFYDKSFSNYSTPSMYTYSTPSNYYPCVSYPSYPIPSFHSPQFGQYLPACNVPPNPIVPQTIPDSVKYEILSIVQGHPDGIRFFELQQIYCRRKGVNLNPLTFGYLSWQNFLAELPDIVKLKNTGKEIVIFPVNLSSSRNDKVPHAESLSNGCKGNSSVNENTMKRKDENDNECQELAAKKDDASKSTNSEFVKNAEEDTRTCGTLSLAEFLKKNAYCLTCKDKPDECKYKTVSPPKLTELFKAALSAKSIVEETQERNQQKCLSPADSSNSEEVIDADFLMKVLQAVCSTLNGINLEDLQYLYEDIHDEPFNIDAIGESSLENWFIKMRNYFEIANRDEEKVIFATESGCRWLESHLRSFQEIRDKSEVSFDSDIYLKNASGGVPADAVLCCKTVPYSDLPADITIGSCHTVYISCVSHPEKFWIHLKSQLSKLEELEKKMSEVYQSPSLSSKYEISYELMEEQYKNESLTCAGFYSVRSTWARVVVMDVKNKDDIYVSFIDYGSADTVSISELRFIKDEFTTLPILCFQAGIVISNRMRNHGWSAQLKHKFSALCLGSDCTACFKTREIPLLLDLVVITSTGKLNVIQLLEETIMPVHRNVENSLDELVFQSQQKLNGETLVSEMPQERNQLQPFGHEKMTFSLPINEKSQEISDCKTNSYGSNLLSISAAFQKLKLFEMPRSDEFETSKLRAFRSDGNIVQELDSKDQVFTNRVYTWIGESEAISKPITSVSSSSKLIGAISLPVKTSESHADIENEVSLTLRSNEESFDLQSVIQSEDGLYQILPLMLRGKKVHIVYLNGVNYAISFEISRLFWRADILLELTCALGLELPVKMIKPNAESQLFQDLLTCCGFATEMPFKTKEPITLVSLQAMITVLPQVAQLKPENVNAIINLVKMFS
ncbi:Tdrd5p [Chamberlinius hualienensis]